MTRKTTTLMLRFLISFYPLTFRLLNNFDDDIKYLLHPTNSDLDLTNPTSPKIAQKGYCIGMRFCEIKENSSWSEAVVRWGRPVITARFDIDYQIRPITAEPSHCPLIARKALTLTPGCVDISTTWSPGSNWGDALSNWRRTSALGERSIETSKMSFEIF